MSLVAIANAVTGDRMIERFHADPRVPRHRAAAAGAHAAPAADHRAAAARRDARRRRRRLSVPVRRYRTPHTVFPHTQFLSNGKYMRRRSPTPAAAPACASGCASPDRAAMRRSIRAATFIYLRDIRSGPVWSPTYPAHAPRAPSAIPPTFLPGHRRRSSATSEDVAARLEIAVSPEHDVEVRLLQLVNHSERVREIDVTSYVEVALAQARDDFAHPAFGKLFIETEFLAERGALICHRRPRDCARSGHVGDARAEPRRPAARSARMGNRSRRDSSAAAAPSTTRSRWTAGRCRAPPGSCSIRSSACASACGLPAGESVRHLLCHRRRAGSRNRQGAGPDLSRRQPRRRARCRWRRRTRTACAATWTSRTRTRCCSSGWRRACSAPKARCARRRTCSRPTSSAKTACGRTASPAICRSCWCGSCDEELGIVRQALEAQEYWRLKGLQGRHRDPQRASR